MMFTLVLTRSYTGNLMSLLAVRYIPQPFQTLKAVLDSHATNMVWEAGSMYDQFLSSVEAGVFVGVRAAEENGRLKYVKSTEYTPILDEQVRHGTHVFIFEDLTGRVLKANDFSRTGMGKMPVN
ncbi:hypothetical protein Pcinc_003389 [Petrolisthes cinctipes]|uniref:Uncharacterized protein n=1 Tax=Petrolisthes cinctipes TaxID=88211 RepID=A0AAE1GJ49_PETCI|nr:hypothetical protein Pcinc_003358 [Petrolisthes cinctipes]KAK3892801.1 hypothetical protein Pcinc_003389 [Petrolisthes cinctipes]